MDMSKKEASMEKLPSEWSWLIPGSEQVVT